jgi:aromatic-amino-acid transaminase
VVCASKDEAARVLSQLKITIRTNYSNPPTHGAQVVATVLDTPALRAQWEDELAGMRVRIKQMRQLLADKLVAAGVQQDFSFITRQRGMFSYSGLTKAQMERLRSEFGVYGVDSGRICVAALNTRNIDGVVPPARSPAWPGFFMPAARPDVTPATTGPIAGADCVFSRKPAFLLRCNIWRERA